VYYPHFSSKTYYRYIVIFQVTNHQYRCPENYSGGRRFPWSEDYANMFQFLQRVRWDHKHNVAATQRLNPSIQGYQEWVKRNARDLQTAFSKHSDGDRIQWWFQRLYQEWFYWLPM